MPDENYCAQVTGSSGDGGSTLVAMDILDSVAPTTTSIRILQETQAGANADAIYANVTIFR
jgi:ABC-type transport system involved in cytochrome bd biosynthesis fused ATPase/permease subunit